MKNKTLVFIISSLLICAIFAGVMISIGYDSKNNAQIATSTTESSISELTQEPAEEIINTKTLIPITADKTKVSTPVSVITELKQTKIDTLSLNNTASGLTYKETEIYSSGIKEYIYTDSSGNILKFSENGELLCDTLSDNNFASSLAVSRGSSTTITEDEAIKLATAKAKELFGSRMDNLVFNSVKAFNECQYSVRFYENLGNDGFIFGTACVVTLFQNGELCSAAMLNYNDLLGFDRSTLDSIDKTILEEKISLLLADMYSKSETKFTNLELDKSQVMNIDDKYVLEVGAQWKAESADNEYITAKYFYFEIE